MKLLIDTSEIIEFVRLKATEQTLLYKLAKAEHELLVSIVTHTELYSGKSIWEREEARQELEKLLRGITILPYDLELSMEAGRLKVVYNHPDLVDCIIAATAALHNLPLATLNTKDFVQIGEVELFSPK